MAFLKFQAEWHEEALTDFREAPEFDLAGFFLLLIREVFEFFPEFLGQWKHFLTETLAFGSEGDSLAGPVKEADAEGFLENLDLTGDVRLCEPEFFGGDGKRKRIGEDFETPDEVKIDLK